MSCSLCHQRFSSLIRPCECWHEFCLPCIQQYLKQQINEWKSPVIRCPNCPQEYTEEIIKSVCPTHFDKFINLKQSVFISCCFCGEDVKVHQCKQEVCKICGSVHTGACRIRCPKCLSADGKTFYNLRLCNCRYQYCLICYSEITPYHYKFWNICGCPIPQSKRLDLEPLKYPQAMRYIMILPKIVLAPLFIVYYTLKCGCKGMYSCCVKTNALELIFLAIYYFFRILVLSIYMLLLIILITLLIILYFSFYPIYILKVTAQELLDFSDSCFLFFLLMLFIYPFAYIFLFFQYMIQCKYIDVDDGSCFKKKFWKMIDKLIDKIIEIKWSQ